ncbi:MAG: long-chain fatty acid--CoA ligase [Actinomycetaceae bacterium]|nr:long-chain fatty acid--CoA ligase [Actinomycetaceae bacterium]
MPRPQSAVASEYTVEQAVIRPDLHHVLDLLNERARLAPNHPAFDVDGRYVTLPHFLKSTQIVAEHLRKIGLQPGANAIVMGATSYQWALAEWGIWQAGAVVVPVYDSSPLATVADIVSRTQAQTIICADDKVEILQGLGQLPPLVTFSQITDMEAAVSVAEEEDSFESTPIKVNWEGDDCPASIVFTSGTTGTSQAAVITHRNFIDLVLNVHAGWDTVLNDQGRTLIFLPLAHVLARGLQMICLASGMRVSYLSDPKQVVATLEAVEPTFLVVVPRVITKILTAIGPKADKAGVGWLWKQAYSCAVEWGQWREDADAGRAGAASRSLQLRKAFFDRLFYAKIRKTLGGSMEFMLSGGAPLEKEVSLAFRAFGVPVMEGYGLTETTAPVAGNRPGAIRSGTVGIPVPGTTIRVDEDGHVLVKGVGVCAGYLDEAATAAAFQDGFFDTGDLGRLDEDGYLTITGRSKELLVTAGGKNVSPLLWENQVESDPLVEHALLIGDAKPFVSAVLVVDQETVRQQGGRLDDIPAGEVYREVQDKALLERLQQIVRQANESVSRPEKAKKFRAIYARLSEDNQLLTPTLKLRRKQAHEAFKRLIDDLYEGKKP